MRKLQQLGPAQLSQAIDHWADTRAERYAPHEGQQRFHASQALIVAAITGNQWGKSSAGNLELGLHITGEYPAWWREAGFRTVDQPCKARIGIPDFKQHGQEMENRFKVLWPRWGDKKVWRTRKNQEGKVAFIEHLPTGSTCEVLTYKQNSEVWEGWVGNVGLLDEPPPRPHFIALWRGLMARGGVLLMTLTPLTQAWMHKWLVKGLIQRRAVKEFGWPVDEKIVEIVTGRIQDNLVNTPKRIAAVLGSLTDEERATRERGEFSFLQGLVYSKQWNPGRHVCPAFKVPRAWTRYCCIDPHEAKPTAVLYLAVAPWGQHFYYREIEVADDAPSALAEACKQAERGERIHRRLIDASSDKALKVKVDHGPDYRYRNWLKAFKEAFDKAYKRRINVTKVTESQQAISLCRERLLENVYNHEDVEVPLIQVFSSCENFIEQIETYQWDEHRGGVLVGEKKGSAVKWNDDWVDCFHYLEARNPTFISMQSYSPPKVGSWMSA